MSTAIKLVAFGAAGYIAYRWLLAPASTSASTATPASPVSVAPSQLDVIYPKMIAAAAGEGVGADGAGVDAWNVYLVRGGGPNPAPSPEDVFGSAVAGDARSAKMTAATYWAGMAPYLQAHAGFTGLGFFGTLCCGGIQ